jgi:hypothetical protein
LQINMHLFQGVRKGSTVITLMNSAKSSACFLRALGQHFVHTVQQQPCQSWISFV